MSTRRQVMFPADPLLVVRMALAALATFAVLAAAAAVLVLFAPLKLAGGMAVALTVGITLMVRERRADDAVREVSAADEPALHAAVERLCLVADVPKPRIVVEPEQQPNSWIVGVGRDRARLHLTRGLLDRLSPTELSAVIAHELAHVVNRDATVMTVVGGPGAALLGGGRRMVSHGGLWPLTFGAVAAILVGWLASLSARGLSRGREFAADAAGARICGSPAALASALGTISEGLVGTPSTDLRAVAARDAFHLVPVGAVRGAGPHLPMPATHPSLAARIARLERLERSLQHGRPA